MTPLRFLVIAEHTVVIQVSIHRGRIGSVIDHIRNEEDAAEHDGGKIGPLMAPLPGHV